MLNVKLINSSNNNQNCLVLSNYIYTPLYRIHIRIFPEDCRNVKLFFIAI